MNNMQYMNKFARKATLIIEDQKIPVIVEAYDILNLQDYRKHFEGHLWSTEMPISTSMNILNKGLSIIFNEGDIKVIRIISSIPTYSNPASENGKCAYFEAKFLAEENIGEK